MFQTVVGRQGQADHVRCQEGGDDRYGHDDGIEEVADDAQRETHGGDDKRELANLGHGESAAHGRLQRLAAQHEREGAEDGLTYQDGED